MNHLQRSRVLSYEKKLQPRPVWSGLAGRFGPESLAELSGIRRGIVVNTSLVK
jgi:hypothetical protein